MAGYRVARLVARSGALFEKNINKISKAALGAWIESYQELEKT